ncbi:hypothetical protein FRB99_004768, partial [Tulasnella sp. 403]
SLLWLAILRQSCSPHTLATLQPPVTNRPSGDLERLAVGYARSRKVFANGITKPKSVLATYCPHGCEDAVMLPGTQWVLLFSLNGDISAWDATGVELRFVTFIGQASPLKDRKVLAVQVTFATQGVRGEWSLVLSRYFVRDHMIHDIFSVDILSTGTLAVTLLKTLTGISDWPVSLWGTLIVWMRSHRSLATVIDWREPDHLLYANVTISTEAPDKVQYVLHAYTNEFTDMSDSGSKLSN